jgi:tetratricopeptide (TPR) repeat protein
MVSQSARAALVLVLLAASGGSSAPPSPTLEDAYKANNRGVALLEQVKFGDAAEAFRSALKADPSLDIAQINLAIALFNIPDASAAQREAQVAVQRAPKRPQAHYVLGLADKALNQGDDAMAAFRHVLELDPDDVGANINLGQLLLQQQKYDDAVAALRRAVAVESYNATAAYNLATALLRSGQRDAGQEEMKRFQALKAAGYATSLSQNYPLQGRYAEAIVSTGNEAGLVDTATPAVKFVDVGAPAPKLAPAKNVATTASVALLDYDGDGDLDALVVANGHVSLRANDKGAFTNVVGATFPTVGMTPQAAIAGDYDNDGKPDVLVLCDKGVRLFHNEGGGKFTDVSTAAGIPAYPYPSRTAAFVDYDHDGDLDILVAGGSADAPTMLLRNDGHGKFEDVAAAAGIKGPHGVAVGIVPTDYDNHRDVDLLIVRESGAPLLFSNQRDGTFKDVAAAAGLKLPEGRTTSVAAGDINKDGYTDFVFGRAEGPAVVALSDGKNRFTIKAAPVTGAVGAIALDYDNDGLLDLAFTAPDGLHILRGLGGDRWADVSSTAAPLMSGPLGVLAAADLDGDGDTDLLVATASGARQLRNDGGEKNASLRVGLKGMHSNVGGIGAKVEARAGSLRSKLEHYAAIPASAADDLVFGIGKRTAVDALRILWPSGALQGEIELPAPTTNAKPGAAAVKTFEEVDRTPSSCPYLFAWNGERFAFVTDFMGGGEMGDWVGAGVYNTPNPTEYVRIRGDQLRERDGRYELRITHELEEVLYVDQLELVAIAHPSGVAVFPNEGLSAEAKPFKLYATTSLRAPASATDDRGHDVKSLISAVDGKPVAGFPMTSIRGYAKPHALTLDLGPAGEATRLLLTGWTEYAFSSDNLAASQAGLAPQPPALEVLGTDGRWRTVAADIGYPVGRPQTIVVDLAGKLQKDEHVVRVTTNLCVYWDQVRVDTAPDAALQAPVRLAPATATLRWRGFSGAGTRVGHTTLDFDYTRVSSTYPWKMMPGRYTREGDVLPLLATSDDRFVIARPGDEIALTFDARALPPLPEGWTRTFLLHADGFSKEMDLHSASPDVVAPLPYHGMKRYPYGPDEAPSRTEAYLQYLETYNTRVVHRDAPLLEALLK